MRFLALTDYIIQARRYIIIEKESSNYQINNYCYIGYKRLLQRKWQKLEKNRNLGRKFEIIMEYRCRINSCSNGYSWNTIEKNERALKENWNVNQYFRTPENYHHLCCEDTAKRTTVFPLTTSMRHTVIVIEHLRCQERYPKRRKWSPITTGIFDCNFH